MENKKIYPPQQLLVALDAETFKLFSFICNWKDGLKYFSTGICKALKTTEEELELSIQTLVNAKLVNITNEADVTVIRPNGEQCQKYFSIPLKDVIDGNGIQRATEVTWKTKQTSSSNMSKEQLKQAILILQAQLKEKEEVEKLVKGTSKPITDIDPLPF